jgi:aspartate ammonia-lyase
VTGADDTTGEKAPTESTRVEHDSLGMREVPDGALYGIHAVRAVENFPFPGRPVAPSMIHAYGVVKLACVRMNRELGALDEERATAIESACIEMTEGRLDASIIAPALQGGAGTSLNMNVNEVLANRAARILAGPSGDVPSISPLDHVNLHQSTNDTFPTALRIAAIRGLRELEREVIALTEAFQAKERELSGIVKVGRTQMQDAVLTTLGREMGAYADAFARDRWRISKCEERLRVVNLGGTAIGTGVGAPRAYIFGVVEKLRDITGLGLARAENLIDATQNADVFVEVSGILKAHASTLIKVATDLRLLSSGPDAGLGEIRLPPRQAGSSIMPGKVNPVIPEAVTQAAIRVMANDLAIAQAASMGSLELNPFLPLIADALLESLELLTVSCAILAARCVIGLEADAERCRLRVDGATASVTALIDVIGYDAALELSREAAATGRTVREIAIARAVLSAPDYDRLTSAERVTRLGS